MPLQDARRAQSQLAEELAAVQIQPAPATTALPAAEVAECFVSNQDQQAVATTQCGTMLLDARDAAGCMISGTTSKRTSATEGTDSHMPGTTQLWESMLGKDRVCSNTGAGIIGSVVYMTADQVATLASQQGRSQAILESLQQASEAQQVRALGCVCGLNCTAEAKCYAMA